MKTILAGMIAFATLAAGGCNKNETAAETQADVAAAQAQGREDIAEARAEARKEVDDVVNHQGEPAIDGAMPGATIANQGDPAQIAALARYDVAKTEAEAAHKVAIERCEGMGEAQRGCKDAANADFDRATEQARRERDRTLKKTG